MSIDPSKYSTIVNVRNIAENMTNEDLKEMFANYGTVTSCKIMNSSNMNLGRFAYVAFEDPDAAEEAIIELNGQELAEGRRIFLRRTHEKLTRPPTNFKKNDESTKNTCVNRGEIFVRNLDPDINAEYLRTLFRDYGTISSAKIIMENGRSKGYGFVGFLRPEAATRAVEEMNGRCIKNRTLHVALARGTDHTKSARSLEFGFSSTYFRATGSYPVAASRSRIFDERLRQMRANSRLANLFASEIDRRSAVREPLNLQTEDSTDEEYFADVLDNLRIRESRSPNSFSKTE